MATLPWTVTVLASVLEPILQPARLAPNAAAIVASSVVPIFPRTFILTSGLAFSLRQPLPASRTVQNYFKLPILQKELPILPTADTPVNPRNRVFIAKSAT